MIKGSVNQEDTIILKIRELTLEYINLKGEIDRNNRRGL